MLGIITDHWVDVVAVVLDMFYNHLHGKENTIYTAMWPNV